MKKTSDSLRDYERFLSKFRNLLPLRRKPKTLIEIAHFPRSELAHSNMLAFFLDPKEQHELGDVFLKALLKAANSPLTSDSLGEVQVIREDPTGSNKRIDIVVEGKFFIIGIENKIGAKAYNPFKDYRKHLTERATPNNGRQAKVEMILLSLKPEKRKDLAGFKPVTYKSFFDALEPELAANKSGSQYAWELVTTIKNLTEGTHMNSEFLGLVKKDQKTAVKLYFESRQLLKELQGKRDDFMEGISLRPPFAMLGRWEEEDETHDFNSTAYTDVRIDDDLVLCLEVNIYLKGWEICAWKRKGNRAKADKWLRLLKTKELRYSADIAEVQAAFRQFVGSIESRLKAKSKP